MFKHILKGTAWVVSLSLIAFTSLAQKATEPQNTPADWSREYPPFRIAGNLYYVGTYDLACYLITTSQGNILINTGLAASASLIRANIETLGFRFADTKILLTTQAHYDHVGAMNAIKQLTGAKLMVDEKDADVMADGGGSDYALGGNGSNFEPIKADRSLRDGDIIKLGNMQLAMLHHPGHTKGSCSFLFNVSDESRPYKILIANLPTIVTNKNFSDILAYPDITKDYKYTLASMKDLKFDIWLASHAGQFALHSKHRPGDVYNPASFMDKKGYDAAINNLQTEFTKKVEGRQN